MQGERTRARSTTCQRSRQRTLDTQTMLALCQVPNETNWKESCSPRRRLAPSGAAFAGSGVVLSGPRGDGAGATFFGRPCAFVYGTVSAGLHRIKCSFKRTSCSVSLARSLVGSYLCMALVQSYMYWYFSYLGWFENYINNSVFQLFWVVCELH